MSRAARSKVYLWILYAVGQMELRVAGLRGAIGSMWDCGQQKTTLSGIVSLCATPGAPASPTYMRGTQSALVKRLRPSKSWLRSLTFVSSTHEPCVWEQAWLMRLQLHHPWRTAPILGRPWREDAFLRGCQENLWLAKLVQLGAKTCPRV